MMNPSGLIGSIGLTATAPGWRSRRKGRRTKSDERIREPQLLRELFDQTDQEDWLSRDPANSTPRRHQATHHSAFWPPTPESMDRLRELLRSGVDRLVCVWTGLTIRDPHEIGLIVGLDSGGLHHLWNAVPVNPTVRLYQGERLVSDSLLERSRDRILTWWQLAYRERPHRDRFFEEVNSRELLAGWGGPKTGPISEWEQAFEVLVAWNRLCQITHRDGQAGWNPYGERSPTGQLSRRQNARWPWRYDLVRLDDPSGDTGDGPEGA